VKYQCIRLSIVVVRFQVKSQSQQYTTSRETKRFVRLRYVATEQSAKNSQ